MTTLRLPNSLLTFVPPDPEILAIRITDLQRAAHTIREMIRSNDHEEIFKSSEMADAMKFVADLNRELLPVLNTLASINHLSIYVGTVANTPLENQQLVSLDVASVSLNGGLLQFNCDLGENCETEFQPNLLN